MNIQQAREVCAQWWAHQIIHAGANWNNGDDSPTGGMTFMLATMLQSQSRQDVTKEQEAIFTAELVKQLEIDNPHALSVDYDPCYSLYQALQKANIHPGACPCKTITWINEKDGDYTVTAALGYHGERKDVTVESPAALKTF